MTKQQLFDELKKNISDQRNLKKQEKQLREDLIFYAKFQVGSKVRFIEDYEDPRIFTIDAVVKVNRFGHYWYNVSTRACLKGYDQDYTTMSEDILEPA